MTPPRQLAPLALAQLAAWRAYAARWQWVLERRVTEDGHRLGSGTEQYHAVCAVCASSIALLSSEGIGYLMSGEIFIDAVTRHLRNNHRGIEAEVYGNSEDATTAASARGTGADNGSVANPH